MALRDYIEVIYRTGAGVASHRVIARVTGASVEVVEPRKDDLWVVIKEVNRVGEDLETMRVSKTDVVALIEGHLPIPPKAVTSRKRPAAVTMPTGATGPGAGADGPTGAH